jgi:hypothetical protein
MTDDDERGAGQGVIRAQDRHGQDAMPTQRADLLP